MRAAVLTCVLAALLAVTPVPAHAQRPAPPLPVLPRSVEVELTVLRDGALAVTEAVSVPQGERMVRRVPLRIPVDGARERLLAVRDVVIEGSGHAETAADRFTIRLGGGTTVIRYTVDGTVGRAGVGAGPPLVYWQPAGGWDTDLVLVRGSFAAPRVPTAVRCTVGAEDARYAELPCLAARIGHDGLTRFSQRDLPSGERLHLGVELPEGTVPSDARVRPAATLAGAFLPTPPVRWAWAALAVLLAAMASGIALARRRDRRTGADPGPAGPLPRDLRPGHVGPLAVGRLDAVDLAATLLDLRARGHLWLCGQGGRVRAVPVGTAERPRSGLESLVLRQIPDGKEEFDLPALHAAARADLVRLGYLRGTRLRRAGLRVIAYGAFLTVLLALTAGHAQLGVVLALAGAAVAGGSPLLPERTAAGRAVLARVRADAPPEQAWAVALGLPGGGEASLSITEVRRLVGGLTGSVAGAGRTP